MLIEAVRKFLFKKMLVTFRTFTFQNEKSSVENSTRSFSFNSKKTTPILLDSFGPDVLRQPGVDADVLSVHGLLGELLDLFDRSRGTPLVRAKSRTMNAFFLMYKPDLQLSESRD